MGSLNNLKSLRNAAYSSVCGFKDFSSATILPQYDLSGVTPKLAVLYNDNRYILKFAKIKNDKEIRDYITEFLSCRIAKQLGYDVQDVELGYYFGKECVALQMFDYDIITFEGFGQSTGGEDFEYDLDMLLSFPFNINKFATTKEEFERYIWSVFILDMFISNFDRHENNWGFRKIDGLYYWSKLYDMGASLYNKIMFDTSNYATKDIKHMIEYDTRCAILYQGKKKNYSEIVNIHKGNSIMMEIMSSFYYNVQYNSFKDIFDELISYNPIYKDFTIFLDSVFKEKIKQMEEWLCLY